MRKIYCVFLSISLLTLFNFPLRCMNIEKESAPVQFMHYWAEYCYRQERDFCDKRRGCGIGRFTCYAADYETAFFDHKLVKELYPEAIEKIELLCIGSANELVDVFSGKHPSAVIKSFNQKQKKLLLQQLKGYEPSLFKLIGNTCLSLTGLAGIGVSAYVGYTSDDIKVKLGSLATGVFSGLVAWYGTKNTSKALHYRAWWQLCPNFQNLITICKTK